MVRVRRTSPSVVLAVVAAGLLASLGGCSTGSGPTRAQARPPTSNVSPSTPSPAPSPAPTQAPPEFSSTAAGRAFAAVVERTRLLLQDSRASFVHRRPVVPQRVTMVQANLYTAMPVQPFTADIGTVFAGRPDFVTLEEVDRRTKAQITPPGYDSYRSFADPWSSETPVVWRSDRWAALAHGTEYLSTRRVRWGVRAVNWVTLRNRVTGRVVSLIAAHPAPTTPLTMGLLPVFARALASMATDLQTLGPVLVGGDLNVGYLSREWPALGLRQAGLHATYDVLGRPAGGTGEKHGATIDYILTSGQVRPVAQKTVRLNSDHRAVWAELVLR